MTATRREFLRAGSVLAGLTLAFRLPDLIGVSADDSGAFEPNAYLRVASDGLVTLWVTHLEMGQGVRTLLPMILAEELEADWTRVRIEQASPGPRFKGIELHTSGSGSSAGSYRRLRTAGAAAREMLIAAASAAWQVDSASCRAERSEVVHTASGRRAGYGALAAAAARLPVPATPALKDPSAFTLLRTPVKRVDGPAIVSGRAQYGMDVRVPGLLFASVERAPTLGGTLVRFDSSRALAVPGVRHVVPVTAGIHPGVAVVADDNWSALQGRAALQITWAPGPQAAFDSDRFLADLPQAFARATFKVRHEGDALAALASADRRFAATYLFPFQAHAPMETMNCTARVTQATAEVWAPTQTDVRTLAQIKKVAGLSEEAITLHCVMMGGGFGRRLFADYAAEAVEVSRAVAAPVQVTWTREDDLRHGYFQPATGERFTAGLDRRGALVALVHQTTSSDLTIYDIHDGRNIWTAPPKPAKAADAYEADQSPWGAFDTPYEFPALRVDCADVTGPVPVGPWRAVEYPSTVFGRESFLDELAHLMGKDPIAFRLELLPAGVKTVGPYQIDRTRLARVLDEARRRSGWSTPPPAERGRRRGRGVAANVYHAGSYLAMIADVSVADDLSDLRVHRLTTVVDCGMALNPLGVLGQTESGIAWGLSLALLGKMDFKAGAAVQRTLAEFAVLRIDRMPELDTVILDSGAAPGGYGEHPVPLVAPAVANAVFAATGTRVRSLPLTTEALRA
ncbi:MAG TPA: molybdopterin cofactor-binding domain-containing protein [Vicinamibacterales bacterium]|nr:molybdopterin cofactor-binding domain-containing protein [Vicinamibacterales bacterium]